MKQFKHLLGTVIALVLIACEGPQGPPGFDGRDGTNAELPEVYQETATFNYDAENNFWFSQELTYNDVVNGDLIMVYMSFGNNLYSPLPASVFDDQGEFQYVFDYNLGSVELQIIGDNDLSNLAPARTANIPIRVAIIPADYIAEFQTQDLNDFNTVMDLSGLAQEDIISLDR